MSDLPSGWTEKRLNEISFLITKGTTPTSYGFKYQSKGISFIKVENINNGFIDNTSIKHFISQEANQSQSRSILQEGDILFSIAGTIGRTCLVRKIDLPANTNQALSIIRFNSKIVNPSFLKLFLSSENILKQTKEEERGGGMNNISLRNVQNLKIFIPPLKEQKRIVEKLDKLLIRVEEAKERLEKIPVIIKRFRQSVLNAAVTGELTKDWREGKKLKLPEIKKASDKKIRKNDLNDKTDDYDLYDLPDYWEWFTISDVCDVKGGKRVPKGEKLVNENTGFPYIKAGNLKQGTVIETSLEYLLPQTQEKIKRYTIDSGDVYITNVGACIGDAGVIPRKFHKANLTENALKLCNHKGVFNLYLSFWLRSPIGQDNIRKTILSAAQGKLALGRVEVFPIPLNSLEEQKEIVKRVDALFKTADEIEVRYKKAKAYVDKLTQSILAKAFRGELVPQDPNDEPAEKLLERIRAEREKLSKEKNKSRKEKSK